MRKVEIIKDITVEMIELPNFPNYYACDNGEIYSGNSNKYLSRQIHNGHPRIKICGNKHHLATLIASAWLTGSNYVEGKYLLRKDRNVHNTTPSNLSYAITFSTDEAFIEWYFGNLDKINNTQFIYKDVFFGSSGEYGTTLYSTTILED
jgi:hypothetical protein